MRILILSPYPAYSHRIWTDQLVQGMPEFRWQVWQLPARHFNWRIRSSPLAWYLKQHPDLVRVPDLILATSMTDLATFKGLFQRRFAGVPTIVYFHENQFAYPLTPGVPGSVEPKMVNLYSALAADRLVFNSKYNRRTFIDGIENFLAQMPDELPTEGIDALEEKSSVIPVPVREVFFGEPGRALVYPARLIWNHRWEYDKGPDRLLAAVSYLAEQGFDYRLELAGQRFRRMPESLVEIARRFADRVVDHGHLREADYTRLVRRGGYVLSTATHDFQGLAVLEAVAAGRVPVVPDRLAYPEWIGSSYLYPSHDDPVEDGRALGCRLIELAGSGDSPRPPDLRSLRFDVLAPRYRELFKSMT